MNLKSTLCSCQKWNLIFSVTLHFRKQYLQNFSTSRQHKFVLTLACRISSLARAVITICMVRQVTEIFACLMKLPTRGSRAVFLKIFYCWCPRTHNHVGANTHTHTHTHTTSHNSNNNYIHNDNNNNNNNQKIIKQIINNKKPHQKRKKTTTTTTKN